MKFSNRLLACTALSAVALLPTSAFAQNSASDSAPTAALEEEEAGSEVIIVTGSRIPTPQFDGVIPGAQVTSETIESRGFTNILDALNDLPLVGPGASPIGNAGGQPASLGAAFVDLLDLGTARTLPSLTAAALSRATQALCSLPQTLQVRRSISTRFRPS